MTPFGSLVVPEVKAISAGLAGSVGERARHRLVGEQVVEACSSAPTRRRSARSDVAQRSGWNCHPAELVGGDEDLRPRGRQDVAEFLAAVEVHDRHDDRTEERRRPERDGGLHPVRQLQRDHVAGPDAARAQSGGEPTGPQFDVGEGARERPHVGVHQEAGVRIGRQSAAPADRRGCPASTSPSSS